MQATSFKLMLYKHNGSLIIDIWREEEWRATGVIEVAETITAFTKSGQLHSNFQSKFMSLVGA